MSDALLYSLAIGSLAILIVVHEGGHFLVARLCGMRVDRFSVGFGPALVKFTRGETTYQISAIPLGGYVQIAGLNPGDLEAEPGPDGKPPLSDRASDPRMYPNRPVYQRLLTIFAGPGTNYLFALLMMPIIYLFLGVPMPGQLPMVGELLEGKPAAAAGLHLGDEVVSVDGHAVKTMDEVAPLIDASQGNPVKVMVLREGEQKAFTIKPEKSGPRWRIGIGIQPRETWVKVPAGQAIVEGVKFPFLYTRFIFHSFSEIFRGRQKAEFSGPAGIVRQMKGQLKRGPGEGLSVIAIISIYLGLFNLLPMPALDGGRLMFLGYEALSRRRVNQRVEQTVHLVGMCVLLSFMLYVTIFKDFGLSKIFH